MARRRRRRRQLPAAGAKIFVYDNDSAARLRGTYEVWMARQLWVNCSMTAITVRGSSLHRVAGDISVAGAIRAARQARRAAMGAPSQQTMVRL